MKKLYLKVIMKKVLLCVVVTSFWLVGCATQQERAEKRNEIRDAVTEAVESRQIRIDISWMNTLKYGSKSVTPDFFLELKGDTLNSYLPYMGQAYRPTFSSQPQGLNFEVPARSIQKSHPKNNKWIYEISARTNEDNYKYVVEIYDTGKATIHVSSTSRDPISFDGELVPISQK